MRRIGQWLAMLGAAFACCLLFSGLVSCAPEEGKQPPAPIPAPAVVASPVQQRAETALPRSGGQDRGERMPCAVADSASVLPLLPDWCGGSGWPLRASTYARAVYAVCPPEGMPG